MFSKFELDSAYVKLVVIGMKNDTKEVIGDCVLAGKNGNFTLLRSIGKSVRDTTGPLSENQLLSSKISTFEKGIAFFHLVFLQRRISFAFF